MLHDRYKNGRRGADHIPVYLSVDRLSPVEQVAPHSVKRLEGVSPVGVNWALPMTQMTVGRPTSFWERDGVVPDLPRPARQIVFGLRRLEATAHIARAEDRPQRAEPLECVCQGRVGCDE
jgi:hypothetical protein